MPVLAMLTTVFSPASARACEMLEPPLFWRDHEVSVGADCSFSDAGQHWYEDFSGSPAINIGNGLIAQRVQANSACTTLAFARFLNCIEGDALGITVEYFGLIGSEAPLPPGGKLEVPLNSTIDDLVEIAQDNEYTFWTGEAGLLMDLSDRNRPDPACGCRIFYPDSALSTQ